MCLAVPGQIVSILEPRSEQEDDPLYRCGKVRFGGIVKQVSLAYVPAAIVGDYVIVHVGFAIGMLDEAEAQQTLQDIEQMEAILS